MKFFSVFFYALAVLFFVSCGKENSINNDFDYTSVEPEAAVGSTGMVWIDYNGKKTKYTTVRAKDGNIWLQQNLGSTRVATDANDSLAYGDYFQWGRWDDGHQVNAPETEVRNANILPVNNPSGLPLGGIRFFIAAWWTAGHEADKWEAVAVNEVNKYNGCDPCRIFGENWRLPDDNEWNMLIDAEEVTNAVAAFNSNLKVAQSGWRSSKSIALNEVNQSGRFWSSTASASNAAFSLLIRENKVIKSFNDSRSYGMSIRCIKKM